MRVDSASTGNWHAGSAPDPRSLTSALARGYDASTHLARQVCADDFTSFDSLLVMDRMNLRDVLAMAPGQGHDRVALFLKGTVLPGGIVELPDPYYGQARDFDRVVELAEQGVDGLIARIRNAYLRR